MVWFLIFLFFGGTAAKIFGDIMAIKNGTYVQRKARQQVYKALRKRKR